MTPERDAVTRARAAIITAIVERTMVALQTEGGAKVLLGDVLDAYRDALLAEVVAGRMDLFALSFRETIAKQPTRNLDGDDYVALFDVEGALIRCLADYARISGG